MKLILDPVPGSSNFHTLRPADDSPHGDIDSQPVATVYEEPDAQRLAACWNACHGLDLPPDIPAGAVATLIAAAREIAETVACFGRAAPHPLEEEGLALAAALAPFAGQNLVPVSLEVPPDRRPVWSFEVDGQHVRWCGSLWQWHLDRQAYVDQSEGQWDVLGSTHYRFIGTDRTRTTFRAVKA